MALQGRAHEPVKQALLSSPRGTDRALLPGKEEPGGDKYRGCRGEEDRVLPLNLRWVALSWATGVIPNQLL
jgi:hypothetical protein